MTATLHQFTMTLTLLYVIKTQDDNQIAYFIGVNASYETMICNEWQSKLNNKCNSIDFNIPQNTSWDCTIWILQNIFLAIWNEISHNYRQVSNIRCTLLGNKFVDHSVRCSWSIACRRCSNYIIILDLTPGFIGLNKDNFKTKRGTFKFGDLVRLILEILR